MQIPKIARGYGLLSIQPPPALAFWMLAGCLLFFGIVFTQASSQETSAPVEKRKTVTDMSVEELTQSYRKELSHLDFELSQDGLEDLLNKVGERVSALFRDFSNTASKEKVVLEAHSKKNGWLPAITRNYYYLILTPQDGSKLSWKEDRTDKKHKPVDQKDLLGYCITYGYACHCIYFHPHYQPGSLYRYLGRETRKPRSHVIAFAQKPEARQYLCSYSSVDSLELIGFLLQGFAWVDPDNFQIIRMRTGILEVEKPMPLQEQSVDIQYSEVRFEADKKSFWLPREVNIELKLPERSFRNRHLYSDYQLFTTESEYKIMPRKIE